MLTSKEFLRDTIIHPEYQTSIIEWLNPWRLKNRIDILIVVDTEISVSPAQSFGIASVIELLRTTRVGCMKFTVDIAVRSNEAFSEISNPASDQAKYRGFRFNSMANGKQVIDAYEQIWCFGFKPSNSGSLDDAEIDQPSAIPASNAELEVLDSWMTEKKGGLFGTGDHHFLGASMCRKIPRLGTMRRWTNADGVPPIGGPDRIDTLRPPEPEEDFLTGGPSYLGNGLHQGDLTIQPIKWKRWQSAYWPFRYRKSRPHPVLCHPTLGPIDVMPDHAHEGLCVPEPNLAATKQFNDELEYPDNISGGNKPEPEVIAWGSNLGSDQYNFLKGEQPARSLNPMIAVYDGHAAGVGRVATDSTWHHWMDININAIKAADNKDWKKVSRYFINLAVWLNPPGYTTKCFYLSVVASHFNDLGFQEYHKRATTLQLGQALKDHLVFHYGPCWVSDIIWRLPVEQKLFDIKQLREFSVRFKDADMDLERFETLVLGNMVEATMEQSESVKRFDRRIAPLEEPEKLFTDSFSKAMVSFNKDLKEKSDMDSNILRDFRVN